MTKMRASIIFAVAFFVPKAESFSTAARRRATPELERWSKIVEQRRTSHTLSVASSPLPTGSSTNSFSNSNFNENFGNGFPGHSTNNSKEQKLARWKRTRDQLAATFTVAGGFVTLLSLILISEAGSWRYFLAGGVCASVSHAIVTPVDVVKTRKQLDPELAQLSFPAATREIVNKEGMRTLLAGLGPTCIGYLFEGAMKFGIYEILKPTVKSTLIFLAGISPYLSFLQSQAISFTISASISGLAAATMLCPMEAIRIRQVADPNFAPSGKWQECGLKMLRVEGSQSLWKGLAPMIYKQVPYTVAKNVAFDFLTRFAYATVKGSGGGRALSSPARIMVPIVSAFLASVLSTVFSQPGDLLLSLTNAKDNSKKTNELISDIMTSEKGVKTFFVGIKTRLLHVGTIVTTQLILYDFIKRLCGIAATGSA